MKSDHTPTLDNHVTPVIGEEGEKSPSSLFAEYVLATEGFTTLSSETGFLTYRENADGSFYIRDIYVKEGFRKTGEATRLADQVLKMAKEKGASFLYGSVRGNLPNATRSISVLIAYGMEYADFDVKQNLLIFRRKLNQ